VVLHVSTNILCDDIKLSVLIALKGDTSLSYSGVQVYNLCRKTEDFRGFAEFLQATFGIIH
jgi:hypothetical protein